MRNRWTFNANTNALGDEAHYVRTRDSWNVGSQLLMNGLHGKSEQNTVVRLASSLRQRGGNTIYRPYEKDNREKHFWKIRTPEEHLRFLRDHQAPEWLWFQIGNEPAIGNEGEVRAMSKWLAQLIRLCIPSGERLVVYNPNVGGFQRWWIDSGWFDELLIALAENAHRVVDGWPQFILGSHSAAYWMGIAAWHCAGKNPADLIHPEQLQKQFWPTRDQIFDADTGDNWILFRDFWFIERARKLQRQRNINPGIDIRIAVTEAGPEDLPNIRTQFPDVAKKIDEVCGRQWRGAPTAVKYYEWVFPHQTAAESLCDDFEFVDAIAPDVYLNFCWYQWTWHNDPPERWRDGYNAGEMLDVLSLRATRLSQLPDPQKPPADDEDTQPTVPPDERLVVLTNMQTHLSLAAQHLEAVVASIDQYKELESK